MRSVWRSEQSKQPRADLKDNKDPPGGNINKDVSKSIAPGHKQQY